MFVYICIIKSLFIFKKRYLFWSAPRLFFAVRGGSVMCDTFVTFLVHVFITVSMASIFFPT